MSDSDADFKSWDEMSHDERAAMAREYETAEVYSFSATFYAIRHVEKTRTGHVCQRCDGWIVPGERAWCGTLNMNGRPVTTYLCAACPWPADKPFSRRDPLREEIVRNRARRKREAMTTERQMTRARELAVAEDGQAETVRAFLETQIESTRQAYRKSLLNFAANIGETDVASVARRLFTMRAGDANALVLNWRNALRTSGLRAPTINSRLAAVRSFVRFGNMLGRVEWVLTCPGLKQTKSARRGPSEDDYAKLLGACETARERALVLLLGDRGLRRGEIASLRFADWQDEGDRGTLLPLRKGQTERVPVTVHGATLDAVRAWLEERPAGGTALFVTPRGEAESGDGVFDLFRRLRARTGVSTSPHRLRRRAITRALDVMNGDARSVREFAGHSAIASTMIYDDKAGKLAEGVARAVSGLPVV